MALIRFTSYPSTLSILQTFAEARADTAQSNLLTLRVDKGGFPASGAAYLATWALRQRQDGKHFSIDGDPATLALLDRLGIINALGLPIHHDTGRADATLYFPVHFIEDGTDVFNTTNDILHLVLREFPDARSFLPAMEWAINEVIDNIMLHAAAPVPGAVCARYDPGEGMIDIGIADVGQGILASLQPVLNPWESHGDAVKKALQRGVTRDLQVGQGNGLAGALEISERNGGHFELWTGDVVFHLRNGQHKGFDRLPAALPGTGASFKLNPHRPVDLADTFMGRRGHNYLEAEAKRVEEAGGVRVRDEVSNTGTRQTARRLRHKVLNLLPDFETPLVLDFEGVERTSSSFLDELLGRLAAELGQEQFRRRIRLINMSPRLVDMANVVVAQRLDQEGLV